MNCTTSPFLWTRFSPTSKSVRRKPRSQQRLLLVLDESGQWIEDDQGRLSQLQALVEEAAIKGQGKLWVIVTTHGDMGSIYKEARALEGDMKKIEGRFRFKPALTTENIELVLEDRLFKKTIAGRQQIENLYETRGSGLLRGLGELANVTSRTLPACTKEKFATYYPFFPYQVHLIPEIVKALRSKGGRGEQMSGSTRTLLAITQDILRAGRRKYLDEGLGALVSFDELYNNLSGEGEISPDVRTELSRIKDTVPGATALTPRVAEVLFLIREVPFIPRTKDNIARLLVETVDDDLTTVLARVEPELTRLMSSGLVARIGEEYEFLTGERRTFEEEVTTIEQQYMQQDRERGLKDNFVQEPGKNHWRRWLDSDVVTYREQEFYFKPVIDGFAVSGSKGDVTLKLYTPLSLGRVTLDDLENQSLRSDEQSTLVLSLRPGERIRPGPDPLPGDEGSHRQLEGRPAQVRRCPQAGPGPRERRPAQAGTQGDRRSQGRHPHRPSRVSRFKSSGRCQSRARHRAPPCVRKWRPTGRRSIPSSRRSPSASRTIRKPFRTCSPAKRTRPRTWRRSSSTTRRARSTCIARWSIPSASTWPPSKPSGRKKSAARTSWTRSAGSATDGTRMRSASASPRWCGRGGQGRRRAKGVLQPLGPRPDRRPARGSQVRQSRVDPGGDRGRSRRSHRDPQVRHEAGEEDGESTRRPPPSARPPKLWRRRSWPRRRR